jgi:Holliday junction DNA helicase RuvA
LRSINSKDNNNGSQNMIGKISGVLEEKNTHQALIDVNGLSYEVEVPITTSFDMPEIGNKVQLYTHFVVREDAQLLYGFLKKQDREMFRVLIKVNGVGPKVALAILSGLDTVSLIRCVQADDLATLVKLPGIGKKTAERLLIELRDKVKSILAAEPALSALDTLSFSLGAASVEDEAEAALIALGYKPQAASKSIKSCKQSGQTVEGLIKAALKHMM